MAFNVPEKFRLKTGPMRSSKDNGNNGIFLIRSLRLKRALTCQASDGVGWEHVSVSHTNRCPTWEEMEFVRRKFWGDGDLVVQFHVPESDHINIHKFCLHLWRKAGTNDFCEMPPSWMV